MTAPCIITTGRQSPSGMRCLKWPVAFPLLKQRCIILMNIDSNAATADLSAYAQWELAASLSADSGDIAKDGTTLNLPPWGVAVLVKE